MPRFVPHLPEEGVTRGNQRGSSLDEGAVWLGQMAPVTLCRSCQG